MKVAIIIKWLVIAVIAVGALWGISVVGGDAPQQHGAGCDCGGH